MSRDIELCSICDQPTGGAGRLDDSLVCSICDRVICPECQADEYVDVVCKDCASKALSTLPPI